MLEDYEELATGRMNSLFAGDVEAHATDLDSAIRGRRIAVVGAAGSIGSALVKRLVGYSPGNLTLVDLSENNLVELVRDLRSGPETLPPEFRTLSIGLGSPEFARFFSESPPFDFVFNLSAIKHVRGERNAYGIARMVDTNMLFLDEFLGALPYSLERFFSVSSDKATAPASLMGASKFGMEQVLRRHAERHPYSTARFANVAYSDGSLLHGFLRRIEKRQPIAAPQGIRRFFMSHREAGELCLLAGILGLNREVFFPRLVESLHERSLPEIAKATLAKAGFEAVECESEAEAKQRMTECLAEMRWPCFFSPSSTSGEKAFEEFHVASDDVDLSRFQAIGVVRPTSADLDLDLDLDLDRLDAFMRFAHSARQDGAAKADYVSAFRDLLGRFDHVETGRDLDELM